MSDNIQREKEIFSEALELGSSQEQRAFVEAECGGDKSLLQAVEGLLASYSEAIGFIPDRLTDPCNSAPVSAPGEGPGTMIGCYKLREKIGEGGWGIVYVAEQEVPVRRRVAIKVIKLGMDTRAVIARFEAERQAIAMMEHPNIARVLDAGATQTGRPYFVMELVRGLKMTDYCDQHHLPTRERLALFIQVCRAVQHAHQKGITHRDLKPSNILVTVNDGVAVPKVIDFGIAKATEGRLTDKTIYTEVHQFIGTPAYMSPEQTDLTSVDIDTRSDIYSLGVLLYELLTGRTPFANEELIQMGLDAMRQTIQTKEPPRPSTRLSTLGAADVATVAQARGSEPPQLIHLVRGDLDWIVVKCLEKDRARRYATANGLAADLQRHLNNEPVAARPPSGVYRIEKFIRRNRLAFAAAAAVIAALVAGLGLSTWLYLRERAARQRAVVAEKAASTQASRSDQVARFLADMLKSVGPSVALGRDTKLLLEILDKTDERIGRDLKSQPDVQADLWNTIGNVYEQLGDYDQAENAIRRAIALRAAPPGMEDVRLASLLGNLGTVLERKGNLAEAESLHRRALALHERLLRPDDPEIAKTIGHIGNVLFRQGKFLEAEGYYRRSLELSRRVDGPQSLPVAAALGNLGNVLARLNRLEESQQMFREALDLQRKLLSPNDPMIAKSLSNLGNTLDALGKAAEADNLLRESVALRRRVLGADHPDLAISLNNLGAFLQKHGKYADAETAHREALAIRRKRLGSEHPHVVLSLNNLAKALQSQGKLSEAESTLREALDIGRRLPATAFEEVAITLDRLGGVLTAEHKLAQAETTYRQGLEILRRRHGEVDEEVAATMVKLAVVLVENHKTAEAEAVWRESLACRRRLLAQKSNPVPADYIDLVEALDSVAQSLVDQDKFAEAEPFEREALDIGMRQLPDDWRTAAVKSLLGECLLEQSKFAEAEHLLLDGYNGLAQHEKETTFKVYLANAAGRLVRLYQATDRPDRTREWEKKLEPPK